MERAQITLNLEKFNYGKVRKLFKILYKQTTSPPFYINWKFPTRKIWWSGVLETNQLRNMKGWQKSTISLKKTTFFHRSLILLLNIVPASEDHIPIIAIFQLFDFIFVVQLVFYFTLEVSLGDYLFIVSNLVSCGNILRSKNR